LYLPVSSSGVLFKTSDNNTHPRSRQQTIGEKKLFSILLGKHKENSSAASFIESNSIPPPVARKRKFNDMEMFAGMSPDRFNIAADYGGQWKTQNILDIELT
jgi:hypothetical protein